MKNLMLPFWGNKGSNCIRKHWAGAGGGWGRGIGAVTSLFSGGNLNTGVGLIFRIP